MKKLQPISEAEQEIMQILWSSDEPLSVQDVCKELPEGKWAYKTVGTLLIRMEEKGAVCSQKRGRANFYTPLLDREKYTREKTRDLVSKLYHGSVKELAVSLFKAGDMSDEDIEEIRQMFDL